MKFWSLRVQQLSNSTTQQLSNSVTQQLSNSVTQQLSNSATLPMHDLILILKRFIPPYKLRVTKSIIFNFLHAIFGSLSIAMLGPILKIIFNNEQDVTELVPFEFNSESIGQIFNYYINN